MKKTIIKILAGITILCAGCSNVNGVTSKDFQISRNEFSKEEQELLTLTGNRVFRYDVKNLPNDKNYELKLKYEVYEDNKKIKEEEIISMLNDSKEESIKNMSLGINILDDKIICLSGEDEFSALAYIDIKENVSTLGYTSLGDYSKININEEVYLFHASSGESGFKSMSLGNMSEDDKNELLSDSKINIFIKLICKEI